MYVLVSRHSSFGKLYLGRGRPVKGKSSAIRFSTRESAEQRAAFWRELTEKGGLDNKFFLGLVVEKV